MLLPELDPVQDFGVIAPLFLDLLVFANPAVSADHKVALGHLVELRHRNITLGRVAAVCYQRFRAAIVTLRAAAMHRRLVFHGDAFELDSVGVWVRRRNRTTWLGTPRLYRLFRPLVLRESEAAASVIYSSLLCILQGL